MADKKSPTHRIFNARLPLDLYQWLGDAAHHRGLSKNQVVIEALNSLRSGKPPVVLGPHDRLKR